MSIWVAIGIIGIILAPVLWIAGGFVLKVLWQFWAMLASLAIGAIMLWNYGMDAFIALPASILLGILFTWLWQRTRIFLRVDDRLGRAVFFD